MNTLHKNNVNVVFIVNCEHISNIVLIVDFEQANVCWVYIEKINTFEDKNGYTMVMLQYFKREQNLLTKSI